MDQANRLTSLGFQNPDATLLEQFRRNAEVFRNTMEAIFQKYSRLEDPGPDVCLETMTVSTPAGVVSLHSAEAEQELQRLQGCAEQTMAVLDNSKDEQMDVTQRTQSDLDSSLQMENVNTSMWHSAETSQLDVNSAGESQSSLWDLSMPEEEDEDLEGTLSSHNTTLLDVYPSMLNLIGDVYRRQHVTKAASAVLRRYRRQRSQPSNTQRRTYVLSSFNHTMNKTIESSVHHSDLTSYHKDCFSYEEASTGRRSQEPSPMKINKHSSLGSSRSGQDLSPLMTIQSPSLASVRSSQEHSSLRATRNVFPANNNKHQELFPLMNKRNVSLASIRSSQELSPLKAIRNASLATSSGNRALSPLKAIRNASLATSTGNQDLSPLKAIRNASLATSSVNQVLSPLKAIRNASLATSSVNQVLSPLKAIRNASLATSSRNQELSPLKAIPSSPLASSGCFYSPRRHDGENSPTAESRSHWTSPGLHLNSKPQHLPVPIPSPPFSDYSTQLDMMPDSSSVLHSAVCSPSWSMCKSPLRRAESVSLTGQGRRSVIPSPSCHCPAQLGESYSCASEERNCLYSPALSPRKALTCNPSSDCQSPLKPRVFSLEEEQQPSFFNYPKQTLPVNCAAILQTHRSPHQSQQVVSFSPYYSPRVFSHHQENLVVPEVSQHSNKPMKCQRSSSLSHMSKQSTSSSISHMSSRQIDAEFRKIYHHFVCQGNSSSFPKSSCHLCEMQSQKGDQTSSIFSNVSSLALTPLVSQPRKRRRQSEEDESLSMKRFREGCSPNQQQPIKHTNAAEYTPSEEKRTWNRALLLQCPSPVFLRASGTRKISRPQTSLQNHFYSPSRRDTSGSVGTAEISSPVRDWKQNGVLLTPSSSSVSRRRLLYGPLQ